MGVVSKRLRGGLLCPWINNTTCPGPGSPRCLKINGRKKMVIRGFDLCSMGEDVPLGGPGVSRLRQIEGLRVRLDRSNVLRGGLRQIVLPHSFLSGPSRDDRSSVTRTSVGITGPYTSPG